MVKYTAADGRAFTDYMPNCEMNQDIKNMYGIKTDYQYRMFLQRNATKLMQNDREYTFLKNKLECTCPSCRYKTFGKK